jgi:hypothetical protein
MMVTRWHKVVAKTKPKYQNLIFTLGRQCQDPP